MDERSPRQPDSSGPPEESGGTPTRGVRPENPYRIPQRPPASDGSAASGASDRPEAWDTPYPAAQGPTGEWNAPQPDKAPPTDTWKDWETPEPPAEEPGPAAPAGGRGEGDPRSTGDVWSRPPRGTRDADAPATAAWSASGDTDETNARSGDAPGDTAWDEQPGGTPGTGSWDSVSSGPQPTTTAWDEQPSGAPATGDTWDGTPQPTGTAWDEQPGGTPGTRSWDNANSGPQPTTAWDDGGQGDSWGEQPRNTPGTGGTWDGAPRPASTAWDDRPGDTPGTGSWDNANSGPQPTTAWGDSDQGDSWGGQPSGAPGTGDTWDEQLGDTARTGSWESANSGPRPTGASWGDSDQSDSWSAQPHEAHHDNGWGAPRATGADDAPAWDDRPGDASGTGSWDNANSGPQPTGAWGDQPSGPPATGDTWDGTPQPAGTSWDEQPGDASGTGSWDNANSGPRPTGASWGDSDQDDSWSAQPHEAHRGPGTDDDGWGGPRQEPAAWNASGGADDAYGDPRDGGRPGAPGHEDEWSGPQQGAGAWDSGDGRGGPPQGPGGPRDGWDDWDGGEPRDEEPAPPGGFEHLYHGNAPAPQQEQPGAPARKSRRGLVIGLVSAVVVLALIGGAASWYLYTLPKPEEATAEYEAAWEAQDYERLAAVTTGGEPAEVLGGIAAGIGVETVDVTVGEPATDGDTGSAPYEVSVGLSNAGDWGWEGELPLVRQDGEWRVEFSPEVAFPGLAEGESLARTAVWGERGQILASDGTRLDTPEISGSLQMIVGETGEATEEDVERLGPAYRVGDTVGSSGLQRTYEERLAGQAATTILKVDAGSDVDSVEVTDENTVATLDGAPGENVVTSIDMAVQNAAASAIIDSAEPAGMVAIRPSTGEILAAVNVPGGFNRAFEGRYPPGSTFKVVSYNALLDSGMGLDSPMECPKEYNPGGWEFTNAGGAEYGSQTLTQAFATSCNTALVRAAVDNIDANSLLASAELFGMNSALDIGVPTFEPVYPLSEGAVMLGAQAIGQGQVETSPLHMATVPAAVADGTWRPPLLVTEPAAEGLPEPRPIGNAEALRTMMRAVITEGTAKDLPFQGEVYGKTGTAEFGTAEEDEELPSHAWMVGFKGDVAFAVVVEGGGGGSSVAGPIAAKFTNAL